MAAVSLPAQSPDFPFLPSRNSSSLFHHSCSPAYFPLSDDLEMLPIKPAASHIYSSLKDLLPSAAAINSPYSKPARPGFDLRIRNRLVKQAAWAYLQPMSTSKASSGGSFLRRLCARVASVVALFCRHVIGALRVVRISTV